MNTETNQLLIGCLAGIGAALLWGIWPVVSRLGVQTSLTPYDITFLRFAVSGLVLLPVFLRYRLKGITLTGATLLMVGAGAPYVVIDIIGLQYTPAGHSGLVVPSCNIIFSTLGAALFLGTRPSPNRLIGLALILLGCAAIFLQGLTHTDTSVLLGNLYYVLGGFLYAAYTVSSEKYRIDAWHAVSIVSVFSAIIYIPVYLFFMPKNFGEALVSDIVIQAVFQGVVTSILAIFLFSSAISHLGSGRAVVFVALMPACTLVSAIPVLGEWPTVLEWTSLGMIAIGILFALELVRLTRRKKEIAGSPPPQPTTENAGFE
jgi:drug/metabolite transporter (DMT)-like permease